MASQWAAAEEAAELVRRHLARLDGLASLTLRVERQTTHRGKTTTERWTLYQKGAGRFRVEYEFPVRRVLVANERELWEHIPQAKKAARTDLAAMKPDERVAFLRGVLARVAVQGLRFDTGGPGAELVDRGTVEVDGRRARRIKCRRAGEGEARMVRGLIDAERLVLLRCEFLDETGQVVATTEAERVFEAAPGLWLPRRVTFKRLGGRGLTQVATLRRVEVNATLSDELFEFRLPDGVERVEP
jgi:hypothetical protein